MRSLHEHSSLHEHPASVHSPAVQIEGGLYAEMWAKQQAGGSGAAAAEAEAGGDGDLLLGDGKVAGAE